jgi:hypothetical protein
LQTRLADRFDVSIDFCPERSAPPARAVRHSVRNPPRTRGSALVRETHGNPHWRRCFAMIP